MLQPAVKGLAGGAEAAQGWELGPHTGPPAVCDLGRQEGRSLAPSTGVGSQQLLAGLQRQVGVLGDPPPVAPAAACSEPASLAGTRSFPEREAMPAPGKAELVSRTSWGLITPFAGLEGAELQPHLAPWSCAPASAPPSPCLSFTPLL